MRDRWKLHASALVAFALVLCWLLFDRGFYTLDEGSLLSISDRVARGDVLYRDVCSAIFPGIYYLLAAAFRIFGSSFGVERALGAAVYVATCLSLYALARRFATPPRAFAGALLFALSKPAIFPLHTVLNYSQVSFLFACLALVVASRTPSVKVAVATGALTSATGLFKQNYGLFLIITILALWWGVRAVAPARLLLLSTTFVAAGAMVTAPAIAFLIARGAWSEFWRNCVLGPVSVVPGAYIVPWALRVPLASLARAPRVYLPSTVGDLFLPQLEHHVMHPFPLLVPIVVKMYYALPIAISIAAILAARRAEKERRGPLAATGLFNLFLYLGIWPRTDYSHLTALSPVSSILAVALAGALPASARTRATAALLGFGVACSIAFTILVRAGVDTPLPSPRGTLRVGAETFRRMGHVLDAIERHVPAGEPLFVTPVDSSIYYMTGRRNPTRFDYLEPVNVGAAESRETAARLERVAWIVASDRDLSDTFVPLVESYAPELAAYLRDHYEVVPEEVRAFDEVHLCRRRDPPPPPRVDLLALAPATEIVEPNSGRIQPAEPGTAKVTEILLSRIVMLHPPEDPGKLLRVTYAATVPPDATLSFRLLARPDTYFRASGPGLYVRVRIDGAPSALYETFFDPGGDENDRRGRPVSLDLGAFAGKTARIAIEAQAPVFFDVKGIGVADLSIR
ncbi:MAG: hypothetical protein U0166_05840 [Acidobacteriota bacterium]